MFRNDGAKGATADDDDRVEVAAAAGPITPTG